MEDKDIEDYLSNQKAEPGELYNFPQSISKYINGLTFPVSKQDLIRLIQRNEASNEILHAVSTIPEVTYKNLNELFQALSITEH